MAYEKKNYRKLCKASESFNSRDQKSKTYGYHALCTGLSKKQGVLLRRCALFDA